jgi:hypothetical protein
MPGWTFAGESRHGRRAREQNRNGILRRSRVLDGGMTWQDIVRLRDDRDHPRDGHNDERGKQRTSCGHECGQSVGDSDVASTRTSESGSIGLAM